ncbi:hypothetical protein PM038_04875 [Halorubrum ezzemoulense]|nr:hypothetical protein [Halorubrum ezzemoulense]MDB2284605.1 hypothetical protein [Halorubrum ezzemoulense]
MFTDAAYDVIVPDDDNNVSIQRPVPSDVNTVQVGVSDSISSDNDFLNISINNPDGGEKYVSVPIESIDTGEINTIDISDLDLEQSSEPELTPELVDVDSPSTSSGTSVQVTDVRPVIDQSTTGGDAYLQKTIRADETSLLFAAGSDSTTYNQVNITNKNNGNSLIITDFDKDSQNTVNDISSLDISADDDLTIRTEGSDGSLVNDGNTVTVDEPLASSVKDLNPGEFAVGSDGAFLSDPVLDDQNQYTILLNPSSGAFADEAAFGEGDDATLDLVSPAGATTQVELTAPDLFSETGEAVRL